jgi:hypothetical protein
MSELFAGMINRRELVSALIDEVSTPRDCALDDTVREKVNKRLGATGLVTAACIDSTCNDGVQLADPVAGAVAHRRGSANLTASPSSHKGKIAARPAAAFDVASFAGDVRNGRVNVATLGRPAARRRTA